METCKLGWNTNKVASLSPALRCASADCCPHFHWRPKCAGSSGTSHKLCNSRVQMQFVTYSNQELCCEDWRTLNAQYLFQTGSEIATRVFVQSIMAALDIFKFCHNHNMNIWVKLWPKVKITINKNTKHNFKFHYFFPRNLKAKPLIMANILLLTVTRICAGALLW